MANDFSGDSNCVALWKFDNNANDSKGGNDLTEVNTPAYDAGDKKEGTHSIDLESGSDEHCSIADGDLDAGFPGKSGTSEQSFSICCWVKPESLSGWMGLVDKYITTGDLRVYTLNLYNGAVGFRLGYSAGAAATSLTFDTVLEVGKWYHIAITYDASDNGMKIRVWDDDAGALLDDNKATTAGGDMSPRAAPLEIGRFYTDDAYTFDGRMDEVVIFNDVLSDDEIDQIRAGTYGGATEKSSSDTGAGADAKASGNPIATLVKAETGSGVDAVDSLQTPEAKTSSDAGSGVEGAPAQSAILAGSESGSGIEAIIARLLAALDTGGGAEASSLETEGQLKDLFASELGEGADRLVARIEMPTKGGGMKLWT